MLEIEAPEVETGFLKFKAQFPVMAALAPAPSGDDFAGILIDEINQAEAVPYGKLLCNEGTAAT